MRRATKSVSMATPRVIPVKAPGGLAAEPLESRRLLAGDVDITSIDDGLLSILGDGDASNHDDTIVVRPSGPDASMLEVVVNGAVAATRSVVGLHRIEIFGGRGDDTIRIDAPDLRIGVMVNGGPGNDTISGGPRGDRLAGGLGDDTIDGGDGNDEIFGGAGDDYLRGGRGADRVVGGEGDDAIDGGLGNDTLIGGLDDDTVDGEAGLDTVRGDAGDDTLIGGTGRDKLFAGLGADRLFGITGRDEFFSDPFDTVTQGDLANPLVAAASEAEIRAWLLRQATRWHHETVFGDLAFGIGRIDVVPPQPAAGNDPPGPAQATGGEGVGPAVGDFSSTNNQVAGVDEADRVLTDGRHIYAVTRDHSGRGALLVIDADPASLAVVSRTPIEGHGHLLYLHGDRITVLSQLPDLLQIAPAVIGWMPPPSQVLVTVLDVSDRTAPSIVEQTRIDGALAASRSVGETVYLVVENRPEIGVPIPAPPMMPIALDDTAIGGFSGGSEATPESLEELRERIATADLDSLLPVARSTVDGEEITQPLVVPGSLYLPVRGGGSELFSIVSLTPNDATPGIDRSVSTLGLAGTIYASLDSFIIASADRGVWWGGCEGATTLHEFSLAGDMPHVAAGTVPGRVLDQFAIDAHADGTVRVVTQAGWGPEASTNLFVLRESVGVLDAIGSVRGIAPGEIAMSARFVGDTAYVVTFEQVDPLFVIDLSDPTQPNIVGELVIPGFSSHLHPLDGTHLLGIGRSADLSGVKLSLFDTSVPSSPVETSFVEIGGGGGSYVWSTAEHDHHAFSFFAGRGVLAIPVSSWTWDEAFETWSDSNALVVYEVDHAEGFTEVARIEHGSTVFRNLRIGGRLFSIGETELKIVALDDPGTLVATLPLA